MLFILTFTFAAVRLADVAAATWYSTIFGL